MSDRLPPERVLREPRFRLSEQHGAHVTVRVRDGDTPPLSAELLDISRTGIKFRAAASFRFEQKIELYVCINAIDVQLDVTASVRWLRPVGDDDWVIGCSLDPHLADEVVTKLARATGTERRHSVRQSIHIEASATWELGASDQPVPVTLCNISTGGFGLQCEAAQKIGQRVVVHVPHPDGATADIHGQTKWQQATPGGCMIGCAFLNRGSFESLREISGVEFPDEALQLVEPRKPHRQPVRGWFVAALLVAMLWPWIQPAEHVAAVTSPPPDAGPPPAEPDSRRAEFIAAEERPGRVAKSGPGPVDEMPAPEPPPEAPEPPAIAPAKSPGGPAEDSAPQGSGDRDASAGAGILASTPAVDRSESAPMRIWIDSSGRYRVRARLVEIDAEWIRIVKENGESREVGRDQLSPADQAYVAELARAQKKPPPSP